MKHNSIVLFCLFIMNFGSILSRHSSTNKGLIRKIEGIERKIINNEAAVTFNNQCLLNNLLPKYSNIRLNNEAVRRSKLTRDFRRSLVEKETEDKKKSLLLLRQQLATEKARFDQLEINDDLRSETTAALENELAHYRLVTNTRIQKKLCNLYGGWVPLPEAKEGFINLSSLELTADQKEVLNLGINFHLPSKFSPQKKKAELEVLFQDALKLRAKNKIEIHPDFQDLLIAESTKNRSRTSASLPPRLQRAARQLRENDNIVIRRADKSAVYVILDKEDYNQKVKAILDDGEKFKKITRNPTEELKKKANDLITAANKHIVGDKLQKITGEFSPGYFYGNPKTHKSDCPLRPIIPQIPLPTYHLAKHLNGVLTPYVPQTYSLRSPAEFVDLVKGKEKIGLLASLDVSSLFTNVPVEKTIDILMDYAYRCPDADPPVIPEHVMKPMLRLCTKKAPFRSPDGSLYYQTDGIAMGSPLGVLFAQAYMAHVEHTVLTCEDVKKPTMYCRYIDDILVDVDDHDHLTDLKKKLEETSGLDFTTEISEGGKINYLDVFLDGSHRTYETSVYRKPTDIGKCLNGASICPDRYKDSVVKAYIHRAMTHCSSWSHVNVELRRVKQILTNNNYPIHVIDKHIQDALKTASERHPRQTEDMPVHRLFYKNTMSPAYKTDEKVLRSIVLRHCRPVTPGDQLRLTIYYQNHTTRSLLMTNNPTRDTSMLKQTNVIYKYKCQIGDCALRPNCSYIGLTTTSLSRRLTMHVQNGGPKTHTETHHGRRLTRQDMTQNTTIIDKCADARRLHVLEAVYIRDLDPMINRQVNARGTLVLYEGPPIGPR